MENAKILEEAKLAKDIEEKAKREAERVALIKEQTL